MKIRSLILNRYTLIAVLLALAGGGWWWFHAEGAKVGAERFRTEALVKGEVAQTVSANGTLNPVVLVSVGTQVSGTVKKLYVDYNAKVTAGQVLLELDDSLYRAQARQSAANVASAHASLDLAQANAARMQALFKQEYVSRQELDQSVQALKSAQAALAQAQAQLEKDNTNLSYGVIRSPVSGTVVDRQVDIGQTVAASFQTPTLFKIAQDLSKMQIDSAFAEADVGVVKAGQPVKFRVDAYPNRGFDGVVKLVRLNPTTTQNVVTYDVVVAVDNPEQILLPGMTAYVNIQAAKKSDVLLLPNAALRFRPQGELAKSLKALMPEKAKAGSGKGGDAPRALVYVLKGSDVRPVVVSTGITDNRYTEVVSGDLKAGDQIVLEDTAAVGNRPGGRPF